MQPEGSGPALPAQADGENALVFIANNLKAGQPLRYRIETTLAETVGVRLQQDQGKLELHLPEGHCTTYHFGPDVIRPYLWPLYGPGQKRVTRSYPMAEQAGETQDHPHHTSLWTAFDEVNGVNNWASEGKHGYTRHQDFVQQEQGPVFGGFTARSIWTDSTDTPILNETRVVRLFNIGAQGRILDYTITLAADYAAVEFGDTKEGGIIAIRVATSMDGARGGLIKNAEGGRGEKECWGQRATWCDYSGPVEGETLGIAVLDHPSNHNHPPRWHARDYGLMTANPLSNAAFIGGNPTPATLQPGQSWTFYYRVLLHRGNADAAGIKKAYQAFAND
ncbi:MAG: PmoA family protein [Abitibacteriaceae bacterium]|nr:PmoA family protein [Abditibacteriaceae bacterium]